MSEHGPFWTFDTEVNTNTVGGGHFDVVTLYRNGHIHRRWVYDGTLARWLAHRRRDKRIRQLRDLYGAVPR